MTRQGAAAKEAFLVGSLFGGKPFWWVAFLVGSLFGGLPAATLTVPRQLVGVLRTKDASSAARQAWKVRRLLWRMNVEDAQSSVGCVR